MKTTDSAERITLKKFARPENADRMRIFLLALLLSLTGPIVGQVRSPFKKFGEVTVADLRHKRYSIDSTAGAVILADFCSISLEGNSKGFFSLRTVRHRVVHILSKQGYDAAAVEIKLFSKSNNEETLKNLKAVTYNISDGKLNTVKLNRSAIFREAKSRNWTIVKFNFPQVVEGSIVEYEYEVVSDFIDNIDRWNFQEEHPVLWNELSFSIPEFFNYAFVRYGPQQPVIHDQKDRTQSFSVLALSPSGVESRVPIVTGVTDYRWIMKDLPGIRDEQYLSTVRNYTSSIAFQLTAQTDPLQPKTFSLAWTDLARELLESEYFAADLDSSRLYWLNPVVKPVIGNANGETAKARRIFDFVQNKFRCTSFYTRVREANLRTVVQSRKGNTADLNILLTALLRTAGMNAFPVLVSTRDNGFALKDYPSLSGFNYVITQVICDGHASFLDPSRKGLLFGKLLPECYNGHARVISEDAPAVYLDPDSLIEKRLSSVLVRRMNDGAFGMETYTVPGDVEAYELRQAQINDDDKIWNTTEARKFTDIGRMTSGDIDTLDAFAGQFSTRGRGLLRRFSAEKEYIDPLFGEGLRDNPFTESKRDYPIEFPYIIDETFVLNFQVPDGYEVEALPTELIAKMDEASSAVYEYRISATQNFISLRTVLRFRRTRFQQDEYESLRHFFDIIVAQNINRIVLRRTNAE